MKMNLLSCHPTRVPTIPSTTNHLQDIMDSQNIECKNIHNMLLDICAKVPCSICFQMSVILGVIERTLRVITNEKRLSGFNNYHRTQKSVRLECPKGKTLRGEKPFVTPFRWWYTRSLGLGALFESPKTEKGWKSELICDLLSDLKQRSAIKTSSPAKGVFYFYGKEHQVFFRPKIVSSVKWLQFPSRVKSRI